MPPFRLPLNTDCLTVTSIADGTHVLVPGALPTIKIILNYGWSC